MHRNRGATVIAGLVIALTLVGGASFFTVIDIPFWLTRSNWVMAHVYHARVRVFWIRTYGDPIDVVSYHDPVHIRLSLRPPNQPSAPSRQVRRMTPANRSDQQITLGTVWQVDDFGMSYGPVFQMRGNPNAKFRISFFRLPVWLIAGTLLLIPIRAAIFGPIRFRRRKRRNLCGFCGYDLTGLSKPRCPECGAMFDGTATA